MHQALCGRRTATASQAASCLSCVPERCQARTPFTPPFPPSPEAATTSLPSWHASPHPPCRALSLTSALLFPGWRWQVPCYDSRCTHRASSQNWVIARQDSARTCRCPKDTESPKNELFVAAVAVVMLGDAAVKAFESLCRESAAQASARLMLDLLMAGVASNAGTLILVHRQATAELSPSCMDLCAGAGGWSCSVLQRRCQWSSDDTASGSTGTWSIRCAQPRYMLAEHSVC